MRQTINYTYTSAKHKSRTEVNDRLEIGDIEAYLISEKLRASTWTRDKGVPFLLHELVLLLEWRSSVREP